MAATLAFLQAAVEYGAAVGAAANGSSGNGALLHRGADLVIDNPVAVLIALATLLVLAALAATRGYRS